MGSEDQVIVWRFEAELFQDEKYDSTRHGMAPKIVGSAQAKNIVMATSARGVSLDKGRRAVLLSNHLFTPRAFCKPSPVKDLGGKREEHGDFQFLQKRLEAARQSDGEESARFKFYQEELNAARAESEKRAPLAAGAASKKVGDTERAIAKAKNAQAVTDQKINELQEKSKHIVQRIVDLERELATAKQEHCKLLKQGLYSDPPKHDVVPRLGTNVEES